MKKIPVFFSNNMIVDIELKSPSPKKPKEVVKQWLNLYPNTIEIKPANAVSMNKFYQVHDKKFVDGIMSCKKSNGFDTKHKEVALSLPYTSGSFLDAALEALSNKQVAVSPTSGFHHATYNKAMGFCTFNGLMVAAYELLNHHNVKHISILDCDHHYGNGTEDIIEHLGLEDKIKHVTARRHYPYDVQTFFYYLPMFLESFKNSDILFYQAGADCHIDDPFGGFLNAEQMIKRDKMIFEFCKKHHIPIVWNLAGGYQEVREPDGTRNIQKVLDLHNNTMIECQKVYIQY